MKFLNLNSIRNKLALLILITVMPCLAILLYSGIEQRQFLIENAKSDILLLTHTIAEAQKTITLSTRQILSTLSQIPTIQAMEPNACAAIFSDVLKTNPDYNNFALVDLNGKVIASGKTFTETNLADRKHIKEALEKNDFTVGEYIVTRVGTANPSLAFAYPVVDKEGRPKAVLTATLKLEVFSHFYDVSQLPEKSFLSTTDYRGVRLFYYPAQEKTNPVGKPIQATAWSIASKGGEDGLFSGAGSDGLLRIFAYVKIHLPHEDTPYLYVWAGIPESYILAPANAAMIRNLLLLLLATVISLFISWAVSRKTLISPLQRLVILTQKFAKGDLEARSELPVQAGELGMLTIAFHDMASSLTMRRKELEESNQHFKTVADFAYDCEYWVGMDGKFKYLSPSCTRITGYSREEILSDPQIMFKMVKPDYAEKVHQHYFEESKEESPGFLMEYPILNKNGEEVWLEHNCCPVYDAHGKYAGRRGSNRDITDRKRTEEALRKSEEQIRLFFERQLVGMAITSPQKGWLQVNNRLCDMLGYQREELLCLTWAELTCPEDLDSDTIQFERMLKGDIDHYTLEKRFFRKTGELLHTKIAVACVRTPDSSVDYVLALIEDLTDRVRAEEEGEKLRAQFMQAQKMESVGRLAGGVAHDYNNMLSIILGYSDLALQRLASDDPLYADLLEIHGAAVRSADITRQLLAFARKQTIAPVALNLNKAVEGMLKMLPRLIGEDIDLAWRPGTGLRSVMMDPSQIDQLLANLCVNARDAIDGVGRVTIETGTATFDDAYCADHPGFVRGDYVLLAISDDGCGMDQDTVGKIFEPFFTTKAVGQGTGLGLATVYGIVKQNNGFINVYSEPGKGTTFKIYLTCHTAPVVDIVRKGPADIPGGHGEIILVVEDDASILKLARKILEQLGYTVMTAESPNQALALASECPVEIDLLLTDVIMPEMDGKELSHRLHELCPQLKTLFMSGYTANVIAHHGVLDAGVHFIQKPFSAESIAFKVKEVLD